MVNIVRLLPMIDNMRNVTVLKGGASMTHSMILIVLFLAVFPGHSALADDDESSGLNKAYQDYYQAIRSGKAHDPKNIDSAVHRSNQLGAERLAKENQKFIEENKIRLQQLDMELRSDKALREKITNQALDALNLPDAQKRELREKLRSPKPPTLTDAEISKLNLTEKQKADIRKAIKLAEQSSVLGAPVGYAQSPSDVPSSPEAVAEKTPRVVIDGSKLPREIEYKKSKKELGAAEQARLQLAQPLPSASPEPSPLPADGIQKEVDFRK